MFSAEAVYSSTKTAWKNFKICKALSLEQNFDKVQDFVVIDSLVYTKAEVGKIDSTENDKILLIHATAAEQDRPKKEHLNVIVFHLGNC